MLSPRYLLNLQVYLLCLSMEMIYSNTFLISYTCDNESSKCKQWKSFRQAGIKYICFNE